MGKKIKEFVTYWGPSITDWNDGTEKRFTIEREEDDLKFKDPDGVIFDISKKGWQGTNLP